MKPVLKLAAKNETCMTDALPAYICEDMSCVQLSLASCHQPPVLQWQMLAVRKAATQVRQNVGISVITHSTIDTKMKVHEGKNLNSSAMHFAYESFPHFPVLSRLSSWQMFSLYDPGKDLGCTVHYLVKCTTFSSDWRYVAFLQTLVALKKAGCGLAMVVRKRTGCDVWQMECQASNITGNVQSDHLLHGYVLPVFFATVQLHHAPRFAKIQPMLQLGLRS